MTRKELDALWFQAMRQSIEAGEDFIRYHFAALATAEKDKEIERLRGAITELLEAARAPGGGNRGHISRPATREHEARVEKAWLDLEAALRREGTT